MCAKWSLIVALKGRGHLHMLGLGNYNPGRHESSLGLAVLGHKPESYPLPLR